MALGRMAALFSLAGVLLFAMPMGDVRAQGAIASCEGTQIEAEGFGKANALVDGNRSTYTMCQEMGQVTLSAENGIHGVYIEFDRIPEAWTLTDVSSGESVVCGENGFLHEYVDVASLLGGASKKLVLTFAQNTVIADVYGFGEGELPAFVQTWEKPCEKADLLLLSTHSDDEQLFFAGILPYYAIERKLSVQVAYLVQHFEASGVQNHVRPHEQLDGLWAVGIRNYPVMSQFPDLYAESKDRQKAYDSAVAVYSAAGFTTEDFEKYITECLRRFKPLVVVSHDVNGEYGHGGHVLGVASLMNALEMSGDEGCFPESATVYGVWEPEKTYLHLYDENPIVMDWDMPLDSLGGKTPFEVTQEGFGCHESQHWTWFYKWIYGTQEAPITKATQIRKYSPCNYGLYDTKVGVDVVGGDFFENVETYKEREQAALLAAQEELARQEEAAREEALKKEQLEKEEELAKEQEVIKQQEYQQELQEKQHKKQQIYLAVFGIGIIMAVCLAMRMARRKEN